ncbi:hypothetical protein NQ314_007984 [Rhamnusium bicolor]|uniref:Cyclic nucleotide-binding domain-containing protein n=1 Tax=Rhamnusium bicolor TaxID=1586634 RepID=A0AAV8YFE3_9CUCU|nr:hypothetical protein NQ314_007984 [Rhamnusium bicolor]
MVVSRQLQTDVEEVLKAALAKPEVITLILFKEKNLRIFGLAETQTEDKTGGVSTEQIVIDFCKRHVGVTLLPSDIERCHRVGKDIENKGKTRAILDDNIFTCNQNLEQLWLIIKFSGKDVGLGVVYRAPNGIIAEFFNLLENALSSIIPVVDEVICAGDVNINMLDANNLYTKDFINLISAYGLTQIVNEPTRIAGTGSSLIDIILVSDVELVSSVGTYDLHDKTLEDHLRIVRKNALYTSFVIQNEIFETCGYLIPAKVIEQEKKSKYFAVLVDETTDVATIEQMSSCFRGYDDARVMSGEFKGTQALIAKHQPKAIYVHCMSHCLNLAILDSCQVQDIRNCFGIIEKTCSILHTSKRQEVLSKKIDEFCPKSKKLHLKKLCPTRWVHDSIMIFVELLVAVCEDMNDISNWTDHDASTGATGLMNSIRILGNINDFDLLVKFYEGHLLENGAFINTAQVRAEYLVWKRQICEFSDTKLSVIDMLNRCNKEIFPNIHELLRIVAVILVTTPERSYITLRRLKTYLRNTIGENRLTSLALMHMYYNIDINVDEMLNKLGQECRCVVADDGYNVLATLGAGSVFGEVSVLDIAGNRTGNRRTANVRSLGYSDLFCLAKDDLLVALDDYPEARATLTERGCQLLRKDGLLDEEQFRKARETQDSMADSITKLVSKVEILQTRFARLLAEFTASQAKLKQRLTRVETRFIEISS